MLAALTSLLYLVAGVISGIAFFTGNRSLARISPVIAYASVPFHVTYLTLIGISERLLPFASFHGAMSVVALLLILIYIALTVSRLTQSSGFLTFPFVFAFHAIAVFAPRAMDPQFTVLWLTCAIFLCMHLYRNWSGKKLSIMSIGVFALVVAGVLIARLFESSFHRF